MSNIDFKFIENYIINKFARPFKRRLKYLYFGLDVSDDTFVLSTTADDDFKYCEPLQATGIILILNREHLNKVKQWFAYCGLDIRSPFICYLEELIGLLNKHGWNNPKLVFKNTNNTVTLQVESGEIFVIAKRVDTYFTLTKLQIITQEYCDVMFYDIGNYFDILYEDVKSVSITSHPISGEDLYTSGLLASRCDDISLVTIVGLDLLVQKSLLAKDTKHASAIRIWTQSTYQSFRVGSYFKNDDIRIGVARDNIFLFPKKRSKGAV